MSKGNGRRNNNGKGNGMDKFNGACNGISSITNSEDQLNNYSNQSKPNAIDSKTGNVSYNNQSSSSIKKFKNKIK